MTWDECYRLGYDKKQAAAAMNCSPGTADKALKAAADRFEAITVARNMRLDRLDRRCRDDAHRIAYQAARPTSERASYPTDFLDLNQRMNDHGRNVVYGPVTNAQRNILAAGLPFEEITPQYGTPSQPHETVSRAQAEFDATARYKAFWEAQGAQG